MDSKPQARTTYSQYVSNVPSWSEWMKLTKMKTKNVSIGLFVVGGLLLFGIGMIVIGDRHQAFARRTEYYSEFVNLAGLEKGAKVRVAGMDAGKVLAIGVPDSPSSRFRVKWRIDAKLCGLVRSDSVATIETEGIVGGTYLAIRPGSVRAIEAKALATIPSKEPTELADLLARGNGLLEDADGMLKGVTTTVSNVNDVVVNLKEGHGTATANVWFSGSGTFAIAVTA